MVSADCYCVAAFRSQVRGMASDQEIWHQFSEGVRRFVSKRVPSSDIDDLVQDILVRANRSLAQLRENKRAEAWIFAIGRQAIADFYRKRERQLSAALDG